LGWEQGLGGALLLLAPRRRKARPALHDQFAEQLVAEKELAGFERIGSGKKLAVRLASRSRASCFSN